VGSRVSRGHREPPVLGAGVRRAALLFPVGCAATGGLHHRPSRQPRQSHQWGVGARGCEAEAGGEAELEMDGGSVRWKLSAWG
jgi:hypothetical protein